MRRGPMRHRLQPLSGGEIKEPRSPRINPVWLRLLRDRSALERGSSILFAVIILFLLGNREVICHSVKMIHEGPAYLFVRGGSGPKIERRPTGNARHARKRRDAKLLVFLDQQARPAFQVLEKPIDLGVQFVATGDLSGRLLDVLDHVNNVTQHAVEGGDRIVW